MRVSCEVDFTTADNDEWRRGFEDCSEIVRDILECSGDLVAAKDYVDKMLALIKERKFGRIKQELGLF